MILKTAEPIKNRSLSCWFVKPQTSTEANLAKRGAPNGRCSTGMANQAASNAVPCRSPSLAPGRYGPIPLPRRSKGLIAFRRSGP
jgi:hypothetical protein